MSSSSQNPKCTQHVQWVKKEMGHALKTTKQVFHFLVHGHILLMWFQACVHRAGDSDQSLFALNLSCFTVVLFPTLNAKSVSCPERPVAFLWVPLWRLDWQKEYSVSAISKKKRYAYFPFLQKYLGKWELFVFCVPEILLARRKWSDLF